MLTPLVVLVMPVKMGRPESRRLRHRQMLNFFGARGGCESGDRSGRDQPKLVRPLH